MKCGKKTAYVLFFFCHISLGYFFGGEERTRICSSPNGDDHRRTFYPTEEVEGGRGNRYLPCHAL